MGPFLTILTFTSYATVQVRVIDFSAKPVLAYPLNSEFSQVFNPSWVSGAKPGLLSRTQNCSASPGQCVRCSGSGGHASVLTFSALVGSDEATVDPPIFAPVDASSVVFGPHDATDDFGTEDPRLAYESTSGIYYMFYTCYNSGSTHQARVTMCLATTADPTSAGGWTRHGPVGLPPDSKSGALLIRPATTAEPEPEHMLFWGAGTIHISRSRNLSHWPEGDPFVTNTSWGNPHVESGPPPLLLSTGDFIFFINSWGGKAGYQPGWVILSGEDSSKIIARAPEPLWSPQRYSWMTGSAPSFCNVANVAFLEAAHPTAERDTFRVYFGGADAVIGSVVVRVTL